MKSTLNKEGLLIIDDFVSKDFCHDLAGKAMWWRRNPSLTHIRDNPASGGGHSYYETFDGPFLAQRYPALFSLYESDETLAILRDITGEEVILSPYELSAVNVKVYPRNKGEQGWHKDTQPLTVLIYLTDATDSPTIIDGPLGYRSIFPKSGRALIMKGREWLHCVAAGTTDRVTVPLNYYYENDTWRPDYVDAAIYSNKPIRGIA